MTHRRARARRGTDPAGGGVLGGVQRQGSIGGSAAFRIRVAGGVLLVAHLAFVAWFTLRPLDVPWVMPANLRPFDGVRADLALGWPEAARSTNRRASGFRPGPASGLACPAVGPASQRA